MAINGVTINGVREEYSLILETIALWYLFLPEINPEYTSTMTVIIIFMFIIFLVPVIYYAPFESFISKGSESFELIIIYRFNQL